MGTWKVTIEVDPATNCYKAVSTRTDSVTNKQTRYWVNGILNESLTLKQQETEISDNLWKQHEEVVAKEVAEQEIIGTLATDLESALNSKEK